MSLYYVLKSVCMYLLSKEYDVENPMISSVNDVINHGGNPKQAVKELLIGRDTTTELSKPILDISFESAVIKNKQYGHKGSKA